MAIPATLIGCSKKNLSEDERVCIHIFNKDIAIPKPLLKQYKNIPDRSRKSGFFQIGLAELLLCTTTSSFIDIFQYFWPISKEDLKRFHQSISVKFEKSKIIGRKDIDDFLMYLREHQESIQSEGVNYAIILTFNDYTKYWSSCLIEGWRNSGIKEFVISKDPTISPYLCIYPSLQKGFKRPPP
jgi:hypothetical protein